MDRKKHEALALCILIVTLLIFFSLISFHSIDLTFFNSSAVKRPPYNWIGFFGANISWLLLFLFGIGAYAIPLTGLWCSWVLFRGNRPFPYGWLQWFGIILLSLSFMGLATLHQPTIRLMNQEILSGGKIGIFIADVLVKRLYSVGAHVLLIGLFLIALVLATPFSLKWTFEYISRCTISFMTWLHRQIGRIRRKGLQQEDRSTKKKISALNQAESFKKYSPPVELLPAPQLEPKRKIKKEIPVELLPPGTPGHYALPVLDILDTYEGDGPKPDWKKLEGDARILEEKLSDFGVQGKVMAISPGPVITMFEYAPAPGIKISRIVGLSDDLSMALKATSIRVVAPIPGKAAIGIEIPNARRELVSIRAVLESDVFSSSPSPLTFALGKDITGHPVAANLGKMPHLLIAGATGTGKSVCINTILSSLLYRNIPDDMRLLLIDPKRIELSSFEGIPHLIHPVVTDAKMATRALRWAVQEMELRYKLLADKNARNIEGYNKILAREKLKDNKPKADQTAESELQHHRLPYVVIIIDELADLMMVASREVEESITRLAQMARAAGIHLILATQRPSVDVLTGIIKANIPTRISFQVSSRIDSRTILDASGAESLLGSGDMLFLPPGTGKIQRIHGAFISENEVQKLTRFWQGQKLVEDPLIERVDFHDQSSSDAISEDDLDEKYEEAIELVLETRQASISMLQRRLRVGYNRAARMIEMMEQQGIVGASDGIKPREVFRRTD
ncbi:MAG: DNA translocase FtsK [Syntrophobacteraceae bacterium]